jgi:hypothetical protein
VTQVERGERPLDSVRTLLEVARALGVEVRDLTGQPWFPEPGGPGHEAVPTIRRALIIESRLAAQAADSNERGSRGSIALRIVHVMWKDAALARWSRAA